MEFLRGQPLSPEELNMIRQHLAGMGGVTVIDPEVRGIVERNWPHLLAKLPPEDD